MTLNCIKNYNLLIFESLDSTNSEALRLASVGVDGNAIILSKEQTAGRGQKGTRWVSLEGNLHASILLDSSADPKNHPQLSFIIANAVHDSIKELARASKLNLDIRLKWPNDILINNKKVAGILLESINFNSKHYVIIGLGINIMQAPLSLKKTVTSLLNENIKLNHPHEFLNILIDKFDRLYSQWLIGNDFTKTKEYWMKYAYNLNKPITVGNGVNRISGIFRGINSDGSMKLELASGKLCNITNGEVLLNNRKL